MDPPSLCSFFFASSAVVIFSIFQRFRRFILFPSFSYAYEFFAQLSRFIAPNRPIQSIASHMTFSAIIYARWATLLWCSPLIYWGLDWQSPVGGPHAPARTSDERDSAVSKFNVIDFLVNDYRYRRADCDVKLNHWHAQSVPLTVTGTNAKPESSHSGLGSAVHGTRLHSAVGRCVSLFFISCLP